MLDLIEKKNLKKKKKKKKKMKKKKKKIFFFCTTKHNITVPPIVHSVMRKDKPKKVQTPQTKKGHHVLVCQIKIRKSMFIK